MPASFPPETETLAVSVIRGLAMDAPLAANSGHQGTAMALAPLAHVLFSRIMRFDPADPSWPDRDRFVLSAGHASILQYALLHLSGFDLSLDDIRSFRQWGSATPGHPEAGHTPGVEVTTGPLGQGFANAVGMALAEAHLRERFGADVMDHHTWVVAGDGCLMEGISHEAASLAGHLALDRLVCIFDDNRITIDGPTDLSCSDDVPARFRAYGWNVIEAGDLGDDLDAIEACLVRARDHRGAPTMVVLRTHIGTPSPDLTDAHEAHGNPFDAAKVSATKAVMGVPDEPFWVPAELADTYGNHCRLRGASARADWDSRAAVRSDFLSAWRGPADQSWEAALPVFADSDSPATRQSFQKVLDASVVHLPTLLVGAADLTGNTGAKLSGSRAVTAADHSGSQVYYGIREHAMGAALVGMALHGGVTAVGGTFFVFADYMRPALRLAALSRARCVFVFSHDSVGVGEDGPTHQPVEHLASLRAIPGLQVIRPADGNETRRAWVEAVHHDGPTALILTRQGTPTVTDGSAVLHGAAVVRDVPAPDIVLLATGSEVAVALRAADLLGSDGVSARVVSMPSWDRLDRAPDDLRRSLFPHGVARLSVEAASTFGWHRWAHDCVGIDRFGASAPGNEVLTRLGISPEAVRDRARALLDRQ